jgi:hypothetical protein
MTWFLLDRDGSVRNSLRELYLESLRSAFFDRAAVWRRDEMAPRSD